MFNEKVAALEESSGRLNSIDFSTPRLYSALLLENQIVPIRNAKPFEQNLFTSNAGETIRKIKTREGADEFETTMELATAMNDICQNKDVQGRLDQIATAHEDVLSSIAQHTTKLAELEESNSTGDIQEPVRQEGDEVMTDIVREEGEIFALEQILSEKRQLLNDMQKELDALADIPEASFMDQDNAMEEENTEVDEEMEEKMAEVERLEQTIQEQRKQEEEQIALYEELLRENDELSAIQQETETISEEDSSPHFEELRRLLQKAIEQNGDAAVTPRGIKEAVLKLQRLLDCLERSQRLIINIDVLHQVASTLIDSCANPDTPVEFDPPRKIDTLLAARALQLISEAGGLIPLPDLKDQIGHEALERGATESLGVQAVYSLVASHLIEIDRSKNPNLVSLVHGG
ncbi:hypothetical protein BGX28_004040 [Mortierella sp. GBA30]|nr:hypothetical protein BGX28_004040 [Mortierella sp. GBA30]